MTGDRTTTNVGSSKAAAEKNADGSKEMSMEFELDLPKEDQRSSTHPSPVENLEGFDPLAPELITTWSSFTQTIYCINPYPNGITISIHTQGGASSTTSNDIAPEQTSVLPSGSIGEDPRKELARRVKKAPPAAKQTLTKKLERTLEAPHAETVVSNRPQFLPNQFHLRFKDTRGYLLPSGRYFLHKEHYALSLEKLLRDLHQRRELGTAVFYFGVVTDPFLSFQRKFNVTMSCLELFEQYQPGRLIVQSRSPMIIAALPMLKLLAGKVAVGIPIETHLENVIQRYTPGQPRIMERLQAADGLRQQGITVNLLASPILPYGNIDRHAWEFAELLDQHGDYISLGCLASGSQSDESALRALPVARHLVADNQFPWLRPYSYRYLYKALKLVAPKKLALPVQPPVPPAQLNLFAA